MSRRGGFTIIEAAIGLLAIALITGALASTFLVGYSVISKEAQQVSADGAVSSASLTLLRDLSSASSIAYSGPLTPGSGSLSVTSGSGLGTTVTYIIDAQGNLLRGSTVAARGLQSLALATSLCQFTVTLTPKALAVAQTLRVTDRVGGTGCF